MTWEYCTCAAVLRVMNMLGEDGWELVAIVDKTAWMKRRVQE